MESSLYLLVPLSVALVFLIGWVFWRALHGGQFDDLDRPGYSILEDDDRPAEKSDAEPDPKQPHR
ncbi:MAG: cytochrome oxidase maturation protein, cbb3-type [Betaproteobacteria bacterium RIFCSPLOWO2_02_FULL_67_19]|nr:MAG: cytochrome oxidase maturation protein, cbb3-type [Betaproteobacteria bacterium RIFCSPLOWO2_02_FULL_67_19]